MPIVVALGGNALLRRGESPSVENQRRNARIAAQSLRPLCETQRIAVTHGNGPQVGLLALQAASCTAHEPYTLDVLGAETEGQIGYLVEQELRNALGDKRRYATILTQVEVDPEDVSFDNPSKPIGPYYGKQEAEALEQKHNWSFVRIGDQLRRVVPSPRPKRILGMDVIRMLVEQDVLTICAGGGGIPCVVTDDGSLVGVEAVIDKDLVSAFLAKELGAQALLMLTDVDGVYDHWGEPQARRIRRISPNAARNFSFAPGSMAPKVEAACDFVEATGRNAGIGALNDASAILAETAGTLISKTATTIEYWD